MFHLLDLSEPPHDLPLFAVMVICAVMAVILGTGWRRKLAVAMLVLAVIGSANEYVAGKRSQERLRNSLERARLHELEKARAP